MAGTESELIEAVATLGRVVTKTARYGDMGIDDDDPVVVLAVLSLAPVVFIPAVPYVAIPIMVGLGAIAASYGVGLARANSPSVQFNKASRKLKASVASVRSADQRERLRQFCSNVNMCLTLVELKQLRREIDADLPSGQISKTIKTGVAQIDRASAKWNWDGEALKESFLSGTLPDVKTVARELSWEKQALLEVLRPAG